MINPFEQFEIKKIIPFNFDGIDLSFSNSALCMIITVLVITFGLSLCLRNRKIIPSKAQVFSEELYLFIQNIVTENIGKEGLKYVPLIFSIFTFIVIGNLLGLFPYSFTFTSHVAAVGCLSLFCLVLNIIYGLKRRGWQYFRTFFPQDVPWVMAPLIVPIEVVSLLSKPFSLTIRLVANMSIGHIVLKVIGSFIIAMGVFGFIPLAADMVVILFEMFIALLQAYIYTVLCCVYLSQAISDEH